MITPTLFIGVGTTGAKILDYLQQRIYEEYLQPDFPIMGLLPIVSDGADWDNLSDTLKRNSAPVNIPSMTEVREDLPLAGEDRRALEAWLPLTYLNQPAYMNGSGNVRAVGRLNYWHNRTNILARVRQVLASCRSEKATNAANNMIYARTGGKGPAPQSYMNPNQSQCRIYVLGTLCGGTCSGLAADLGYDLRREGLSDVTGIFVALCSDQARQGPERSVQAANCYAALTEFDYHYRSGRRLHPLQYPDGKRIAEGEIPYAHLYILSPVTMANNPLLAGGQHDYEGLLQVIALSLFLDVTDGTATNKLAVQSNTDMLLGPAGPSTLDRTGRRPRAYASFGTATITYPKYQLAVAAGCQVAKAVLQEWLKPAENVRAVGEAAGKTFKRLQEQSLSQLRQGENPPEQDAKRTISAATWVYTSSALNLERALKDYPRRNDQDKTEPFIKRLQEGGGWYVQVQTQYNVLVARQAKELILRDYRQLRCDGSSVPTARKYLQDLQKMLREERDRLAAKTKTTIDAGVLSNHLRRLKRLEKDNWLLLAGQRSAVLAERKQQLMDVYQKEVVRALDHLVAKFEVQALDGALQTIAGQDATLQEVERQLRACFDPVHPDNNASGLQAQYTSVRDQLDHPSTNCKYLFSAGGATQDIERYAGMLNVNGAEVMIRQHLLSVQEWTPDLVEPLESNIINRGKGLPQSLWETLVPELLRHMQVANARSEAARQWDASYSNMVTYSYPYIEIDPVHYFGQRGDRLPVQISRKAIFASGTPQTIQNDIEARTPQDPMSLQLGNTWNIFWNNQLDSRVIFYCEEPGFSTTYMRAMPSFEDQYRARMQAGAAGGQTSVYWTDKRWLDMGGPPIDVMDLAEAFSFLAEHAVEVLSDQIRDKKVRGFACRQAQSVPYFSASFLDETLPYSFNIGEDFDQYLRVAQRPKADKLFQLVAGAIVDTAREMGEEEFRRRYQQILSRWEEERLQRKQNDQWTDSDQGKHQQRVDRLNAFAIYVTRKAWNRRPNDGEDQLLQKACPWLM
jgi:hypothetical protein